MAALGSWNISIAKGALPQKLATGITELFDNLVGASYTPLIYVGSQIVNGINHMVIAEQVLADADATKNIVKVVINKLFC